MRITTLPNHPVTPPPWPPDMHPRTLQRARFTFMRCWRAGGLSIDDMVMVDHHVREKSWPEGAATVVEAVLALANERFGARGRPSLSRYAVAGIVSDIRAGRRVLALAEDHAVARDLLVRVLAEYHREAKLPGGYVVAAAGREELRDPSGGSVVFADAARARSDARAKTFDVLVVHPSVTHETYELALPTVAPGGEVVWP